jgi:hypothetical protein
LAANLFSISNIRASTELKLYPVEDTYVSQYEPSANYGGTSSLDVSYSDNMFILNKNAFLKFDLSQIPSNANIENASLHVYTSALVTQTQTILVLYCPSNSWQELALTWNNMPSHDTTGWSKQVSQPSTWYSFNINPSSESDSQMKFVSRAISSSDKKLSIVISSNTKSNDVYFSFYSKDQQYSWMQQYEPYLTISYTVPSSNPSGSANSGTASSGGVPSYPAEAILLGIVIVASIFWVTRSRRTIG